MPTPTRNMATGGRGTPESSASAPYPEIRAARNVRVHVFVPVLVERAARERLEHLGATG